MKNLSSISILFLLAIAGIFVTSCCKEDPYPVHVGIWNVHESKTVMQTNFQSVEGVRDFTLQVLPEGKAYLLTNFGTKVDTMFWSLMDEDTRIVLIEEDFDSTRHLFKTKVFDMLTTEKDVQLWENVSQITFNNNNEVTTNRTVTTWDLIRAE